MSEKPLILIVDDAPAVAKSLEVLCAVYGLPAAVATTADEAESILQTRRVGVVIQDMNLSSGRTDGGQGIALFRRLRSIQPGLAVILITAWTSLETAVSLVKEGAIDYMAKPWDDEKLIERVHRALQDRERSDLAQALAIDGAGLVCESTAMRAVVELGLRVAPSNAPLLITGPNGAGKEKLADLIVAKSMRADKPYVKVNAGALPDQLIEAELFGAERGAFTGSDRRRVGRFEAADGGTLLLDEIGNLPEAGQRRLLRVLQSGEFERLGSSSTQRVDVRIVAATNEDLTAAVQDGRFREDLLFRLNVIELAIPPLSARRDDVLPLAEMFIRASALEADTEPKRLPPETREALLQYPWPGNVRELENRARRAMILSQGPELSAADLGIDGDSGKAPSSLSEKEQDERAQITKALRDAQGVVADAARTLGLSRQALYRRMQRLNIVVERVVDR